MRRLIFGTLVWVSLPLVALLFYAVVRSAIAVPYAEPLNTLTALFYLASVMAFVLGAPLLALAWGWTLFRYLIERPRPRVVAGRDTVTHSAAEHKSTASAGPAWLGGR